MGPLPFTKSSKFLHVPTCFNSKERWILEFTSWNLATIKKIRKKYNVNFASVILCIVSQSLREILVENGGNEFPTDIFAGITLPWPNHPAHQKGPKNVLCNHW